MSVRLILVGESRFGVIGAFHNAQANKRTQAAGLATIKALAIIFIYRSFGAPGPGRKAGAGRGA
jgi:hypothetical protein